MAFERVLVPLDGSRLAEASLPVAKALGRQLGTVLVLVHVLEHDPPEEVHGETHLGSSESAQTYLNHQRDLCRSEGLSAEVHVAPVESPDVADTIVELAERFEADLVAMCAHGRRSLKGRLLGPIAQRALRGGGPPIMLRTAGSSGDQPVSIDRILLPVDFRHDLATALEDVVLLAGGFEASVTLLHAIDAGTTGLPARMLPNTSLELDQRARDAARDRLAEVAHRLEERDVPVEIVVTSRDPDDAIIDLAHAQDTDLIILVSHGRSGVSAWYERSVGRRIIREPQLNLLLLREPDARS